MNLGRLRLMLSGLRYRLSQWRKKPEPLSISPAPERGDGLSVALGKARTMRRPEKYKFPIVIPTLMRGVVPADAKPAIAMDDALPCYDYARISYGATFAGFPGYPYLASLATRAEYRAMASALATELTREWITLNSSETAGEATKAKVTEITKKLEEMGLQQVIRKCAEHDAFFGRGQIALDIDGQDREMPLVLSNKTIKKGANVRIKNVEPLWTTPAAYNALDPLAADFYKPSKWFMLGKQIHASRLLTIITRELPDMLKPAFNFGGMSLSQLAEPYVDNWLRTRQSVADLINNFSITALATSMEQVLDGSDDGKNLFDRATLFTEARANQGLMLLDKDREELVQVNTPLSGLYELQAQSQEHMCAVSRLPAIILTGISPSGLNASSEGEIRTFYDWIAAQQEAYYRTPIYYIICILQLVMYGEIDPDITFSFDPLYQMTPKELSEIRTADATTAATYIDRGVIDPDEERERLARDPESGYQGLDLNREIGDPNANGEEENNDE